MFLFLSCRRKEESKVTTQKCRRGNYIIEQIEVVLDVVVQVWQVEAHFKALVKLESVVPLVLPCFFFTSQTRPPEHCVVAALKWNGRTGCNWNRTRELT